MICVKINKSYSNNVNISAGNCADIVIMLTFQLKIVYYIYIYIYTIYIQVHLKKNRIS